MFCKNKSFDKLFITREKGFPYAAAMIMCFFAEDTVRFLPEFEKPYQSITINNIEYTRLSPEVFDQFALFKFATLERNKAVTKD